MIQMMIQRLFRCDLDDNALGSDDPAEITVCQIQMLVTYVSLGDNADVFQEQFFMDVPDATCYIYAC